MSVDDRTGSPRATMRGVRDVLLVALPKVAGGALLFGLNLLLLRFLGVDQFGVYGLCMAAILLAEAVLGGPFDLAVLKIAPPAAQVASAAASQVERAALHLKLGAILAIGLGLTLVSGLLTASAYDGQGGWQLVPLTAFAVAAMLALRSVLVHLQLRQRFAAYGAIDLLHVGLKFGAIGVLLAVATPGVDALLVLLGAGPLLAALAGGMLFARHLLDFRPVPLPAYRELGHLTGWYFATIALGAFIGHLDVLALGWLARIDQVGIFAAGLTIASVPALLGSYLAIVLAPRILAGARSGALPGFHRRVQGALFVAAAVAGVLALAVWDDVFVALLPPDYHASARIARILLPGTLAAMVTVPMAVQIVMLWRKTLVLRMDCLVLPALLALYAVIVPRFGEVGAAWVTCAALLGRSAVIQIAAWRCVASGVWADAAPSRL